MQHRLTLVSMSGLRVGDPSLLAKGMRMPGLVRRASALAQLPPLGLLTIAAMVPKPWEVHLLQDDGQISPHELADQIIETAPNLVAFSSLTPSADRAAKVSDLLRNKRLATVIGGLHATADPTHCRRHFDVVVQGDGEPSIVKLLDDWSDNRLKPSYLANSPFDLSHSPLPRWELLGEHRPPRYTLQTMRGCPWNCSFCAASRLLGPPRIKPDAIIERELQSIARRQSRPWIELADDNTFASDRDHATMLEMLAQHGARWFTESDWRIALRPELLHQIARSGCRQILIGLESHVFRYPGMGAKTADWHRMVDAVQAIQEAGIVVNACFIVGADGETPASIERLGDFLETAPFGEIQITLQTPFPGTSLHRSLSDSGRLLPGDYSRFTLFDVTYQPNLMTAQQLQSCFHALIERVFADHNQQRRNAIQKTVRKKRRI